MPQEWISPITSFLWGSDILLGVFIARVLIKTVKGVW